MNNHFFGFARGRISQATERKVSRIAAKHGAFFNANHSDSGGQQRGDERSYFGCQNRGAPFDQATAEAVEIALKDEGLWPVPTTQRRREVHHCAGCWNEPVGVFGGLCADCEVGN